MSQVQQLRMLAQYTAWANALLYESLHSAPEAISSSDRPGRRGGILEVLGHIYVVAQIWKAHLLRQEHKFKSRKLPQPLPISELQKRQAEVDRWYVDFAEAQTPDGVAKNVDFVFVGGAPGNMKVEEILLHVANHATYHRGYVADMLYDAGSLPPTMDLPVYIRIINEQRQERPAPARHT